MSHVAHARFPGVSDHGEHLNVSIITNLYDKKLTMREGSPLYHRLEEGRQKHYTPGELFLYVFNLTQTEIQKTMISKLEKVP